MKNLYKGIMYIFMVCLAFSNYIPEDISLPCRVKSVTTKAATNVTRNSATLNANVGLTDTYDISCGVIYGTSSDLSLSSSISQKATANGDYSINITGLENKTTYYYRAYAVDAGVYRYGKTSNFTTASISAPQFSAETVVSNIDLTSFKVEATLLDDGGSEGGVQMGAFLYIPAEKDVKDLLVSTQNVNIKSVDNFSTTIDNLYTNTRYAVRPMAISSIGIGYGAITYVTTTATDATLLSTCTLSDTTTSSISVKALVLSAGAHPIVEAGFCYSSETKVPTTQNLTVQTKLEGTELKATLTDLNAKTRYYIRAYAKNDQGTVSYSETIEYVVAEYKDLDVRTDNADEISATSARLWGYVRDNNVPVSERGFCWSTSEFQPEDKKVMDNITYVVADANNGIYTYTLNAESNTTYYFCAYAKNSDGEVYYGEMLSFTTLKAPEPEAIDLGLSVLWASCNVGATSPEDYGGYYAWGETEEKTNYDWSTYKWCKGSKNMLTKYCTDSQYGTTDNKTTLDPEDDVAHVKWGEDWRMPTLNEINELCNNCTVQWTSVNGINGYRITSRLNSNSIFLPASGGRYGEDVYHRGSYGIYWSDTLYKDGNYSASVLYFYDSDYDWDSRRHLGHSVRPVKDNPNFQGYDIDVYTDNADDISASSARLWGYVTDNNVPVSERGFCWSNSAFQPEDKKVMDNIIYVAVNSNEAKYSYTLDATSETTYYFCTYVKNSYGVVYYGDVLSFTTPEASEAEAIDLGLSVKWASFNVGATSPEGYGDYFAWGETSPKSGYHDNNSVTFDLSITELESRGIIGSDGNLTAAYDAATANWGGSWRMPTEDEIKELSDKCSWEWTKVNGVSGQKVTGPNGNSIFLPAAGYRLETSYGVGLCGYYWSAPLYKYRNAYFLYVGSDNYGWDYCHSSCGLTVRPVSKK